MQDHVESIAGRGQARQGHHGGNHGQTASSNVGDRHEKRNIQPKFGLTFTLLRYVGCCGELSSHAVSFCFLERIVFLAEDRMGEFIPGLASGLGEKLIEIFRALSTRCTVSNLG